MTAPPNQRDGGVRCLVFDVDDTLYLERDYVRSGFWAVDRWARVHLGVAGVFERAWERFESGHRRTIFDEVVAELSLDPASIGTMVEVYRSHDPEISLLADSMAALETAASNGAPIAVVTDGPAASQWGKVRALGLDRWASLTVVTADLGPGRGKPHPAAFELVQDRLGHCGPDCAYVADNPAKDFAAPAALGWRTVRVRRVGSLHEHQPSGPLVGAELADLVDLAGALR